MAFPLTHPGAVTPVKLVSELSTEPLMWSRRGRAGAGGAGREAPGRCGAGSKGGIERVCNYGHGGAGAACCCSSR